MYAPKKILTYKTRYWFIITLMLVCLAALLWRMINLTVIDRQFLQNQGDARSIRNIPIAAYRGMITDRNGEPLAISTPVESVWLNPQSIDIDEPKLATLAQLLSIPINHIQQNIQSSKNREFIYLKRGLNPNLAAEVKALKLSGVYLRREFRRYYPTSAASAHLIGFTNIDDKGQEGIELAYNDWLSGAAGVKRVVKDRMGRVIIDLGTVKEPNSGNDITLSIDRRVQHLAHKELEAALKANKAKSGTVIVLDAKTGEVLAMVNQPSFNPNIRIKTVNDGRYRNRAVTDLFEPGSVIKAFTVASALESELFTPDTLIDTTPGWMALQGHTVRDIRNFGEISIKEAIMRSSNVAMTKMTLASEDTLLWDMYNRVGFGHLTSSGFPGERQGTLINHAKWKQFNIATMSFGYGLAVTSLQLAQSFTVFANDGKLVPVTLLKTNNNHKAEQAIKPEVAKQVLAMLEEVVESPVGTGRRAQVSGFKVAGKTGTARILGPQGYKENHHVASFIGIAPADNPRYIISIVIEDPQAGTYYGGAVAAPVFSKIMAGTLRILEVMPSLQPKKLHIKP